MNESMKVGRPAKTCRHCGIENCPHQQEKKAANLRYHSTPEGMASKRAATKRYQYRKRIELLENKISPEGVEEYIVSVKSKIKEVEEKLQEVTNDG